MKSAGLTLIVMLTLLLSACADPAKAPSSLEAYCSGVKVTLDEHVDALVRHGESIISVGAGDVLVTGDQLVTVNDKVCNK